MNFFALNKIPEYEKTANNIVYNLIDDYSLEQQNAIIKIIATKIITNRKELVNTNQKALNQLQKILNTARNE